MTMPEDFSNITCQDIRTNYGPMLARIDKRFWKELPIATMCHADCLAAFEEVDLPSNVVRVFLSALQVIENSSTNLQLYQIGRANYFILRSLSIITFVHKHFLYLQLLISHHHIVNFQT